MASVIGVVSQNSAVSPVLGLLISLGYTYVFVALLPFKKLEDSFLGVTMAYSLVLFFVAALMVKANISFDPSSDQRVFGVVLIFIMISGPLCICIQLTLAHIPAKWKSQFKSYFFYVIRRYSFKRTIPPLDSTIELANRTSAETPSDHADPALSTLTETQKINNPIVSRLDPNTSDARSNARYNTLETSGASEEPLFSVLSFISIRHTYNI